MKGENRMQENNSVWPDGSIMLSIFSPLQLLKIAQQQKKFTKVGLNFATY